MNPELICPGSARPVDEINRDIRALWLSAGDVLTVEEQAAYSALLAEYMAAVDARATAVA